MPDNDGAFVLQVKDGRGSLVVGGSGGLAADVGAFSSLYTGWASAESLFRFGRVRGGSSEQRACLDAAFAGAQPWMLDDF